MDKLAELVVGEIPDAMVDSQVETQLENMAYRLQSQGIDLDTYMKLTGMSLDAMRTDLRPRAEVSVKIMLALEKIAELEGVTVTDEELEAEYNKFAEQYNMTVEQVKMAITDEGLKGDLTREKASKIVLEAAVGTDPDAKPKKTAAKKPAAKKTTKKAETAEETEAPAGEKPKKAAAKKTTKKAETEETAEEKPKRTRKTAAKKDAEEKAE